MALVKFEQFQDMIARLFPEFVPNSEDEKRDIKKYLTRTFTFQVTDSCNLNCTYCYQINKGKRRMSLDVAKKAIDQLLTGDKNMDTYMNPECSPAIVIDFIGGEPFLEVELIEQICDYFVHRMLELDHPWLTKFCFSLCSNGVLYFDEKVQHFLHKYRNNLSLSITIDGNKELHDACRVFYDGSPSYDIAVAAAKDWMSRGYEMGSKITIAPENIDFMYTAIIHMIDLGYTEINANCVYEKGWTQEHAEKFYYQLKKISDYLIENDLFEKIYISLFDQDLFKPKDETDNENWCGGTGSMLAVDPDGRYYPCIRYMESSLGDSREPLIVGDVDNGISYNEKQQKCINCLNAITRRSQSTDECFYCPIAAGCGWCSGYNYQENGTVDKRVTYICEMHKARALANRYYWQTYYNKYNIDKEFVLYVPDEWALKIISQDELDMLKKLK